MWITFKQHCDNVSQVVQRLETALRQSRFTATVESTEPPFATLKRGRLPKIKLSMIRLRNAKFYCGQHPGPCIVNPFIGERPHRRSRCLEGADWIGFNDMVNTILDKLHVDADVYSDMPVRKPAAKRLYIRRGLERRINYDCDYDQYNHPFWVKGDDCDFADYCGKTPPETTFPNDTPGQAVWRLRDEVEPEHAH